MASNVAGLIRKAGQDLKKVRREDSKQVSGGAPKIQTILEYIESPWGLNMDGCDGRARLFGCQKFIVKLYYGLELDTKIADQERDRILVKDPFTGETRYTFSESEYLEYLFNEGRCNIGVPDHIRRELVLALGRRSGKTSLSGIFASYELYRLLNLYNPQEYYGLPNGNRIQLISIATDKEQAALLFNEVTSHLAKCDYFAPYISSNTQSKVEIRTPYDIDKFGTGIRDSSGKYSSLNGKSTIRVSFKPCNGKGLRGAGNVVIVLDEVAHFLEKGGSSAEEIYGAVSPSAAAFSRKDPYTGRPYLDPVTMVEAPVESRVVLISSPLGRSGLFFNKFDTAIKGGKGAEDILAIQSPTWEINPTVPRKYYEEKFHENPQTFWVEFGAQFSDQTKGWIEREVDLQACIDPLLKPVPMGRPRAPHQLGLDVGIMNDGTALAITHAEGDKIVLDYHETWTAGVSWQDSNPHLNTPITPYAHTLNQVARLDFDEIAKWLHKLCQRFCIMDALFDRWNGLPLEQSLHKLGLKQFRSDFFTRDATSKMYQTAKMLMLDEKLSLYDYPIPERRVSGDSPHSPHIAELLSLQANHISKTIVLVEAPKKRGAHDDFSDAYVRSVWLSAKLMGSEKYIQGATGGGVYTPNVQGAGFSARRNMIQKVRRTGSIDRNPFFGRRH